MDLLTSVEPQLVIPVVGVVLCALLVYIFGFQSTQEPSFQHLAVLQAAGKGSRGSSTTLRQRSATPKVTATPGKTKEKPVANGSAVSQTQASSLSQEKTSPKLNGVIKKGLAKDLVSNKENVRPQKSTPKKEKVPREAAEDLEAGDWIQAPSRKDKKNKTEKTKKEQKPSSAGKDKNASSNVGATSTSDDDQDFLVLKDVNELNNLLAQRKQQESKPTEVAASQQLENDEEVEVEAVVAPVEPPAKSAGKAKKAKAAPAVVEASPKKSTTSAMSKAKEEVANVKVAAEPEVKKVAEVSKENAAPVKKQEVTAAAKPVEEQSSVNDPRNNIAFDEMGDTWEEAKSRGTKKRRARKD